MHVHSGYRTKDIGLSNHSFSRFRCLDNGFYVLNERDNRRPGTDLNIWLKIEIDSKDIK